MNLNEKIAKWLGFKLIYNDWDTEEEFPYFIPSGKPKRTHMIDAIPMPNFTESMDACIKWIVSKIDTFEISYDYQEIDSTEQSYHVSVYKIIDENTAGYKEFNAKDESLPTAFCLAVEKLIDAQNKE